MNASRLRQGIDYELQVSATNEEGRSVRPDCVVNLPNGIELAVDAKFPYDAFERSLDEQDADARRELQAKHARDLRGHVKTLREKSYWEAVSPAPEFVVCFIPSDFAMSAALDADPDLLAFAANERVVIVGPTNLLSLLWSVGFMVRQQQIVVNAEQIAQNAEHPVRPHSQRRRTGREDGQVPRQRRPRLQRDVGVHRRDDSSRARRTCGPSVAPNARRTCRSSRRSSG